jgi:hypothetical protein
LPLWNKGQKWFGWKTAPCLLSSKQSLVNIMCTRSLQMLDPASHGHINPWKKGRMAGLDSG